MHFILHNKYANYQIKILIIEQIINNYNMSFHRLRKLNIPGMLSQFLAYRKEKNSKFKMHILIEYLIEFSIIGFFIRIPPVKLV